MLSFLRNPRTAKVVIPRQFAAANTTLAARDYRCSSSCGQEGDVIFADTGKATRRKTTQEVIRGWLVFKLFTYDALVNNSLKVHKLSEGT